MARPKIDVERKEQILSAFETCVIQHGLAKTTLQKVADQAELPRSLVRYFVGNRDKMVALLIQRMIERAEAEQLSINEASKAGENLNKLLDYLFDGAFANDTSNQIVDQLWHLAASDQAVCQLLQNMYQHLQDILVAQMAIESVCSTKKQRQILAQSLINLSYGESCFDSLAISPGKRSDTRLLAQVLVDHHVK